jgi:hypothetical protein
VVKYRLLVGGGVIVELATREVVRDRPMVEVGLRVARRELELETLDSGASSSITETPKAVYAA